ncbi:universal stress protein [Polaribacter sp. R77954]|uniref:universal stress protein n=1 Tax=Polaribacter sp. R77954 TaxID=3093870 RepID=UPI0037C7680E
MPSFNKILVGIAFSPNLKPNLFEAVRLANLFNADLIGVHVGSKSKEKEEMLYTILKEADALQNNFTAIWKAGKPVEVILETCEKEQIDLLILGALQKEKLYKYYVGSVARKITRKAPCSILLLIKPSVVRVACKHIVVNGLEDKKTEETIKTAFVVSDYLNCKKITIVEEIKQEDLRVKIEDDKSLRKATIAKNRIELIENRRVKNILKDINSNHLTVKTQSIFGKRGYSIGHYATIKRADLLVMNAPKKLRLIDRIFPHDLEYILSELPTDVLIVK